MFLRKAKPGSGKISLKVPSEIRFIREVSSKIVKTLTPLNVAEDKVFDIRLCVEEAVRNAMVHGNNSNRKLAVRAGYWIEDGAVIIEIEDEGKGFDHTKVPDPTDRDNMEKNSGRGVYLIKRLMDAVTFNERGNKIKMVKRLS